MYTTGHFPVDLVCTFFLNPRFSGYLREIDEVLIGSLKYQFLWIFYSLVSKPIIACVPIPRGSQW